MLEIGQAIEIVRRCARAGVDAEATAAVIAIAAEVLGDGEPQPERQAARTQAGTKPGRPKARRKTRRKVKRKYVRKRSWSNSAQPQAAETNGAHAVADASADAPKRANAGEGVTSTMFSERSARAEKWTKGQLGSHPEGMARGELLAAAHKTGVSEPAIERSLDQLGAVTSNEVRARSACSVVGLP